MLLNMLCTDLLKACALAPVLTLTAADSFVRGVVIEFLTGLPIPLQRIVNALHPKSRCITPERV